MNVVARTKILRVESCAGLRILNLTRVQMLGGLEWLACMIVLWASFSIIRKRFGFLLNGYLPLLGLCFVMSDLCSHAFVYETAAEFHASGDFDGDGRTDILIVDKATGGFRIGYQLAPGSVSWAATRSTGIQNVSALGVGRLTTTNRDAFVCAAPPANRLNLIDVPEPDAVILPVAVHINAIGPNMVGVIDIGGMGNTALDDLFVGSIWNNSPTFRWTLVRNTNGIGFNTHLTYVAPSRSERANRVSLKAGTTDRLGIICRGVTNTFRAFQLESGTIVQTLAQELPAGSEYLIERFNPTNVLSQFISYKAGTKELVVRQVLEDESGNLSLGPPVAYTLEQDVQSVYVVPDVGGARLLIIYAGGCTAEIFDFDGVSRLVCVQQFSADSGLAFTGVGVLGSGHFQLFSGIIGTGVSRRFQTWIYNGTTYTAGEAGALPYIGKFSALGNVLLFQYEPFVTNNPHLVYVFNAGDWTSQFHSTGSPPVITVIAERYGGTTDGLRNPTVAALGLKPPMANFGLVNQYTNFVSVFSLDAPVGDGISEVKIAPTPGHYKNAIEMTLTTADPTHFAYYRLGSGGWQLYSVPVRLFTNVTVQFYAKAATTFAKSPIQTVTYTFADPPSMLDSDDDGVPDFVEIGKGLNPNGGPDSDGDGYSDLEELIRNTNPLVPDSAPTNAARLEFKATFDRAVTPRPYDGLANLDTYAATGTGMRVYAVRGSLLSAGVVTYLGISGVTNPACLLTNIVVDPEDRMLVEATDLHFDIVTTNTDKRLGRELVGLLLVPRFPAAQVPYTYSGGNLITEANAWIAAASNLWIGMPREISKGDLTINDTLTAVLVEQKLSEILVARGLTWGTNITLFPFRASDKGRSNLTRNLLLWLEKETTNGLPGWRMETIYRTVNDLVENSTNVNIAWLRAVAVEIYDICSSYNNENPATFIPPLDELRYFLRHCTYDSNYLSRSTLTNVFASACAGANAILAAVPARPVTNVLVVAIASAHGRPADSFQIYGGTTSVLLYKNDGSPYDLPDSFGVLPGSLLLVCGYADLPTPPDSLALEVISVSLASIPLASDSDSDGNLLVDTWEKLFFGSSVDPFDDWDGDGYQNLQEMLDGSDPRDPFGVPFTPKARFDFPYVELIQDNEYLRLRFNWPESYIHRFVFGVKGAPQLDAPFRDVAFIGPIGVPYLQDTFDLLVLTPEVSTYFYFIYLGLRE